MEKRQLTKADIDKVRHIEGFPIAKDEDIIALSDPPYYTACPNPFIEEFIREHGTPYDEAADDYKCEPFAADVSEGKTDPFYMAHSYHTKVPYKAIMRYILHYTKPGDVVFDGFCGTGMTGVAAQMCGCPDASTKSDIENEMPGIVWGARKPILSDLSPAAGFIAYNYNTPVDASMFREEARRILDDVEKECGWMYKTIHIIDGKVQKDFNGSPIIGHINYTVWSDVFICPTCSKELIFWDVAVDMDKRKVLEKFPCSNCGSELKKSDCGKAQIQYFDAKLNEMVTMTKQIPVLINYSATSMSSGRTVRFEKKPDEQDFALIDKINAMDIRHWYPTNRMCEGSESRRNDKFGITHVHHFYTRRNLTVLATLVNAISESQLSSIMMFCLTSILIKTASKLHNIGLKNGKLNLAGAMPNALYIPSQIAERNILELIAGKIADIAVIFTGNKMQGWFSLQNSSLTDLRNFAPNTIDYIFTDPPFGGNLNYSELSFIWEAWLKAVTRVC